MTSAQPDPNTPVAEVSAGATSGPQVEAGGSNTGAFHVTLSNFEGPFDLLLQLIGKHKLDVTEIALSVVTDEFIAHVRAGGKVWDLEQTSSFLVVAATLLDLKAARLLPSGEVEDAEDLGLLEARDLLFARLLQYRAFKQVAGWLASQMDEQAKIFARPGGLEEQFQGVRPEVTIPGGVVRLARLAEQVFTPREVPVMPLLQLHTPQVSVPEQAELIVARLRRSSALSFRALTGDADRLTTVARFLALLELYRAGVVSFEQLAPLSELTVRWTGEVDTPIAIIDDYDDVSSAPSQPGSDKEES